MIGAIEIYPVNGLYYRIPEIFEVRKRNSPGIRGYYGIAFGDRAKGKDIPAKGLKKYLTPKNKNATFCPKYLNEVYCRVSYMPA